MSFIEDLYEKAEKIWDKSIRIISFHSMKVAKRRIVNQTVIDVCDEIKKKICLQNRKIIESAENANVDLGVARMYSKIRYMESIPDNLKQQAKGD